MLEQVENLAQIRDNVEGDRLFIFPLPGEEPTPNYLTMNGDELTAESRRLFQKYREIKTALEPVLTLLEGYRRQVSYVNSILSQRQAAQKREAHRKSKGRAGAGAIYLDQWLESGEGALRDYVWYSSTGVELLDVKIKMTFVSPVDTLSETRQLLQDRGLEVLGQLSGYDWEGKFLVTAQVFTSNHVRAFREFNGLLPDKVLITYSGEGHRQSQVKTSRIFGKKRP